MTWLNPPRHWRWDGADLHVRSEVGSDFWRAPDQRLSRDSGHAFLAREKGDLAIEATVRCILSADLDHAGVMLRLSGGMWVRLAVQLVRGVIQTTATVTRDTSDWSVHPLPGRGDRAVRLRIERTGDTVSFRAGVPGSALRLLRVVPFPGKTPVGIGPVCASPQWGGLEASFLACKIEAAPPDWTWYD